MPVLAVLCAVTAVVADKPVPVSRGAPPVEYVADTPAERIRSRQDWGTLGINTAAKPDGKPAMPLQIGDQKYPRGLGSHAKGQVIIDLDRQYDVFEAEVGVQPQGANRGTVIFRVLVDGKECFNSGVVKEGEAAKPVRVSVRGAVELALVADDAGDNIYCDLANWADARLVRDPTAPPPPPIAARPEFGPIEVYVVGEPVKRQSWPVTGFSLVADDRGPQVAVMRPVGAAAVCARAGERVEVRIPVKRVAGVVSVVAHVDLLSGDAAGVGMSFDGSTTVQRVKADGALALKAEGQAAGDELVLHLTTEAQNGEVAVRWRDLRLSTPDASWPVTVSLPQPARLACPPPEHPPLRPALEAVLIEWDWRMQDGIGTERLPGSYAAAVERLLQRGDALLAHRQTGTDSLTETARSWEQVRSEWKRLSADAATTDEVWEALWRRVHQLRREAMLKDPVANTGPLVFAKHVPGGVFSHQLTQYQGDNARPGGGIFVLEEPGRSMRTRPLSADVLPQGACMYPEVSFDGREVLFAYCQVDSDPPARGRFLDRHFHLYRVDADGSNLRRLTDGPYDDFAPRHLPNGKIVFASTRRGGYHRCGAGPCPVYTLALCEADGSNPHPISYHETHEWDPAVLNDGRVIYTRWDYVDRHAVYFEQLWTVRPDGSGVRAFYGNNTRNPIGVWEARPVPGSSVIMATAGAHHAMTAGSIILVDPTSTSEGLAPITRLTPDVPFPESESGPWGPQPQGQRWPGHCYRSPWPLSDSCFLAAYSYDQLVGEPGSNRPNMFGLYLADRFGNLELLYRDLNISSLWPVPLRPRVPPPAIPSVLAATDRAEGTFFVQNVHDSWVPLPKERMAALRIVQVLPKTTPNADQPRVGSEQAAPGKQVLGTVPVEADGSALFRAPARIPLLFQALDAQGRAVQMMHSVVYLQPGETASCAGCHERDATSPPLSSLRAGFQALARPPSSIRPGPDGSKPWSYPLLVQPVLDKNCASCHNAGQPREKNGGVVLTGDREGAFSRSYNALVKHVPISSYRAEPARTYPDRYGARASALTKKLLAGHHGVALSQADLERLYTWMDTSALFYGTFNPKNQERQLRGERIEGPDLE